jgi:hypothetical protein
VIRKEPPVSDAPTPTVDVREMPERVWLCTPRGGYGYTFRIPCVVLGIVRAKTKIAVLTAGGQLKTRFVSDRNLTDFDGEIGQSSRGVLDRIRAALLASRPSPGAGEEAGRGE